MDEDASFSSEDSGEPYYHLQTGKIFSAREAWSVLAAEGHPRYRSKLSGGPTATGSGSASRRGGVDFVFQGNAPPPPPSSPESPPSATDEDSETGIHQTSSFLGPTQSSIDKALHPESPNYISPNKDPYKKSTSYEGSVMEAAPASDDEDDETDPVILRARAMALAAQNGQKLTPEQMQLIAQPDVQQQKLIEEAKRVQLAKEERQRREAQERLLQQLAAPNLQKIGADFKKFIQEEKEKPPLQWGADLGKFIENQSQKIKGGGDDDSVEEGSEYEGNESEASRAISPPTLSPKTKKMEGFGTDPNAPRPTSPGELASQNGSMTPVDPSSKDDTPVTASSKGMWPSMNVSMSMPPLPLLNESITNILPGAGGNKGKDVSLTDDDRGEQMRISGILWKRRSGFGKHSTTKAWERRRVELKGSKLMYYKSAEEEEEEEEEKKKSTSDVTAMDVDVAAPAVVDRNDCADEVKRPATQCNPLVEADEAHGTLDQSENMEDSSNSSTAKSAVSFSLSTSKRSMSIFGQAAQAAEQRLQSAKDELSRLATATGLESLRPSSADTPRGILDLRKEKALVSASMGHSGAPTPFCISIKVKSETKWKFCFDDHRTMMEWLSALTDVVVMASVASKTKSDGGGDWKVEEMCVRLRVEAGEQPFIGDASDNANTKLCTSKEPGASAGSERSSATETVFEDEAKGWMIAGVNLYVAWAMANIALIIARCSTTSIDQYWMIAVGFNVGIWQLCTRPKAFSMLRPDEVGHAEAAIKSTVAPVTKPSFKPIAGDTTVQVTKVEDPNVNEKGHQLPSWLKISSSGLDIRSHGYLTSKKKIPSPGELYECVAVDCFVSNTRFPEIAPRVRLPTCLKSKGDENGKSWKSPDIFIASIVIPTEAPRFGHSTDDGPGLTIVGYFKMKEETRKILRQLTADGYRRPEDPLLEDNEVQKDLTNGVRLWERYCNEAPNDQSFQARFKLIPCANLEELGCPSYIAKYNGKPVLIKRRGVTGFFNDYPSLNAMEFDISLHPFPYLFKQAMAYLKDYFDRTVATFGFVIEGRSDDELPEVVIGVMKVVHPSPKFIVRGEDFFAGTCPKSSQTQALPG